MDGEIVARDETSGTGRQATLRKISKSATRRETEQEPSTRTGELLRKARLAAGISQLELALELGVSQRHLSFVERGRSQPGRELLTAWFDTLDVPMSVRNAILLHAGHTVLPSQTALFCSAAETRVEELRRFVDVHNPFPAFLFGSDWRVISLNDAGRWLCSILMPDYPRTDHRAGIDMIHAITSPQGLFSRMNNAPVAAAAFLHQLRTEEWANPELQPRVDVYERSVRERFVIDIDAAHHMVACAAGVLKFDFTTALGSLSFCAVQSVIGLPQDITLHSPRIILWFPADEQTREVVLAAA